MQCHFLSNYFRLDLQPSSGRLPKSVFPKQKAFWNLPISSFLKFGKWPSGAQRAFAVPGFLECHPMNRRAKQSQLLPFLSGAQFLLFVAKTVTVLESSKFTSFIMHSINIQINIDGAPPVCQAKHWGCNDGKSQVLFSPKNELFYRPSLLSLMEQFTSLLASHFTLSFRNPCFFL